ncbi:hypothetical protein VB711_21515 [Cronbergia sp. UHCC 0137]|uniref:hypothetical protein n=1 Tax=Cronbergia sp. UHCC 0137 TaxID=3110239 RepID=UPI002B1FB727|nr:hypothetical protein [Cronbergia sp. UHCC 0137]MEA5620401.1 hypothetical protein [Cronbergia sp. UHCC 0137]
MMIIQKINEYQKYSFEQKTILRGAFKKIDREIKRIRWMIYEQKGFWIFKNHVYSKETLFNELDDGKIVKILDNVEHLTMTWNRHGILTRDGIDFLNLKRDEITTELENIQNEIARRDPTWWEQIYGIFIDFTNFVRNHIPQFAIGFFMGVAKYPVLQPLVSLFLPSPNFSTAETKLLEQAIENYIDINADAID